jgi:hypothetical protein
MTSHSPSGNETTPTENSEVKVDATDAPDAISTASLLEQMDKEQDQVLLQLDQLNLQIEALIEDYAQSRREEQPELVPNQSELLPHQSAAPSESQPAKAA